MCNFHPGNARDNSTAMHARPYPEMRAQLCPETQARHCPGKHARPAQGCARPCLVTRATLAQSIDALDTSQASARLATRAQHLSQRRTANNQHGDAPHHPGATRVRQTVQNVHDTKPHSYENRARPFIKASRKPEPAD